MRYFRLKAFFLALLGIMISCQKPDPLLPSVARKGINSITATFEDGRGDFIGEPVEDQNRIIVPIPYFYPEDSDNQVTAEDLKNMRVKANLDDNVVVDPPLLFMDLNQENVIKVIDQRKDEHEYIVTGEIRKSSASSILSFSLPEPGLDGIIDEAGKTILIVTLEDLDSLLAEVRISPHATISPDPREEFLDYNEPVELTVTAHDGVTTSVYTVKQMIPDKLPFGIRPGSAKRLFAKKLKADLGIMADHLTGGLAATQDFVVINTRGENSLLLDPITGEVTGELELGGIRGGLTNFYTTADDAGNILICNLAPNAGSFKIWKSTGGEMEQDPYIEWDDGLPVGRKISVNGSLDGDAVITAPILQGGMQFARWEVTDGALGSETPEIVTMSGLEKGWTTNADIVYTSTDPESDYFVASYSDNTFAWVDGKSDAVHKKLEEISVNYIMNAVDFAEFNNASYVTTNWVNSFNWGAADMVWLLDVSSDSDFSGNLETGMVNAVVWQTPQDTYGPKAIQPVVENANGTGDVALVVSDDGYYLYLYFLFTNGYVVGYQFDCLDI